MPIKSVLLRAIRLGLLLSPCFAAWPAAAAVSAEEEFVPPVARVVVAPVRLPWGEESAAVTVRLMVDARGVPRQVEVAELVPTELRELVVAAVAQWRFSPATRHGAPVSARVVLPLNLTAR